MGFKLYGFAAEAARIAHDVSVAASHFLLNQLPELYTASERTESNFPVQYIGANVPQAWAAGSVFMLFRNGGAVRLTVSILCIRSRRSAPGTPS